MNKPNWKDAPEWAQWLAQDVDGMWYWYETEPELGTYQFVPNEDRTAYADTIFQGWRESLESRPE